VELMDRITQSRPESQVLSALDPQQKYTTDRYQKRGGAYADPHKNP